MEKMRKFFALSRESSREIDTEKKKRGEKREEETIET
jgi:hypothetical protein